MHRGDTKGQSDQEADKKDATVLHRAVGVGLAIGTITGADGAADPGAEVGSFQSSPENITTASAEYDEVAIDGMGWKRDLTRECVEPNPGFDKNMPVAQAKAWLQSLGDEYAGFAAVLDESSGNTIFGYSKEDLAGLLPGKMSEEKARAKVLGFWNLVHPQDKTAGPVDSGDTEKDILLNIVEGNQPPFTISLPRSTTVESLKANICTKLRHKVSSNCIQLEMPDNRLLIGHNTLARESLERGDVLHVLYIPPDHESSELVEGPKLEQIVALAKEENLTEHSNGCETYVQLKEGKGNTKKLESVYSEDLCALANRVTINFILHGEYRLGFLVLGLCDNGKRAAGWDYTYASALEPTIAQQVRCHFYPPNSVNVNVVPLTTNAPRAPAIIVLTVRPTPFLAFWDGKAYLQSGTSSSIMTENEVFTWLKKLSPTTDFTANPWGGKVDAALVMEFAQSLWPGDVSTISAEAILSQMGIANTMAARILFGDVCATINFYPEGGLPTTETYKGLYRLLTEGRKTIHEHAWKFTNVVDSIVIDDKAVRIEHLPYHPAVLREALVNSIMHTDYRVGSDGWPAIQVYPDRLVITNAASPRSEVFRRGWFSARHYTINKKLASVLAKHTNKTDCLPYGMMKSLAEERGFGKQLIMKLSMQSYKRAPCVELVCHVYGVEWSLTVFDGIVPVEQQASFKEMCRMFRMLIAYGVQLDYEVALAMLSFRSSSQQRFFEALPAERKEAAEILLQYPFSPCFVQAEMLHARDFHTIILAAQEKINGIAPLPPLIEDFGI